MSWVSKVTSGLNCVCFGNTSLVVCQKHPGLSKNVGWKNLWSGPSFSIDLETDVWVILRRHYTDSYLRGNCKICKSFFQPTLILPYISGRTIGLNKREGARTKAWCLVRVCSDINTKQRSNHLTFYLVAILISILIEIFLDIGIPLSLKFLGNVRLKPHILCLFLKMFFVGMQGSYDVVLCGTQ